MDLSSAASVRPAPSTHGGDDVEPVEIADVEIADAEIGDDHIGLESGTRQSRLDARRVRPCKDGVVPAAPGRLEVRLEPAANGTRATRPDSPLKAAYSAARLKSGKEQGSAWRTLGRSLTILGSSNRNPSAFHTSTSAATSSATWASV